MAPGQWPVALLLYGLGVIGFSGANALYDALLVVVAGERKLDIVSALGFALGYLGGGLLFAGNVLMTLYPQAFGLPNATVAVQLAFSASLCGGPCFPCRSCCMSRNPHSPTACTVGP